MARSDSSFGLRNYPQTIVGSAATPLLVPSEAGIFPGLPSPLFPVSTTVYPVGLFIGIPPDVSGGSFDGHPFEIQMTAKISSTVTTNVLVNLFNAKQSSWKDGPYTTTYTLGTLGAGCTNVVTGTATVGLTASATVDFWMKAQFIWGSGNSILSFCAAEQYLNGSVVPISATSNVTGLGNTDLNFIPQFTFSGGGENTVNLLEFVINRL